MFYEKLAKVLNSDQSRCIALTGNIQDLFYLETDKYEQLVPYLCKKVNNLMKIVYTVNGEIIYDNCEELPKILFGHEIDPIERLRHYSIKARSLKNNLLIIIEGADLLFPEGNMASLGEGQIKRIGILQRWFSDPLFLKSRDSVILIAESKSQINSKISKMPQLVSVEIEYPNLEDRKKFINGRGNHPNLPEMTAGLSLYAIDQIIKMPLYEKRDITNKDIISKVEDFIKAQVGEDAVEFSKPEHTLKDLIGFRNLKKFCNEELIPRIKAIGKACLPGAVITGSIGSGKTYIFEAVASEIGIPVLVIKNIRSQWYGQTDVIFERFRRILKALDKVIIFVDEADAQFGSIEGGHETERRLTGKIQMMMSDPALQGKCVWLLMTARVHLLSADIRRPKRAGDLIIPIFDPEGEDRIDFIKWMIGSEDIELVSKIDNMLAPTTSAAFYSSLKSYFYSMNKLTPEQMLEAIADHIPADIEIVRKYQTLQALINCTRKSLLPEKYRYDNIEKLRNQWSRELLSLEK